jgi:hypothetical protein
MPVRAVQLEWMNRRVGETDLREVSFHPYLFLSCGARHARRQRYHSRRQ